MSAPWPVEMRAEQLVLELREILVRFDENIAAHHLMQDCVPYFLDNASHPAIARARADQAAMVDHIVGDSYAHYYETNHHERPFEEQYGIEAGQAHEYLHRVRFLRQWLTSVPAGEFPALPTLLDCACNDGWMAVNLQGIVSYHGLDLNPHCLERAEGRAVPGARFERAFAEDAERVTWPLRQPDGYDVVTCFELIEHVRDPDAVIAAMVGCCKPGGSLFVSTPLGACTGGDLPQWWLVEPKGHVRAYTPETFGALLSRHAHVDEIQVSEPQGGGNLMVARAHHAGDSRGRCRKTSTR